MTPNIKILCTLFGGSHLYGLNTPASDLDYRGIFMHTDYEYILGTKRFEEERKQDHVKKEDHVFKELNHFFSLLKQTNSEALEVLFAPDKCFTTLTEDMMLIRSHCWSFVDSKRLFTCLSGYIQGELRLALGERKGQIGGKRYEQVQKYGFSPKNVCQMRRLAYMGETFFNSNQLPVRLEGDVREELLRIKTKPELYSIEDIRNMFAASDLALKKAFDERSHTFSFDEDLANKLLLKLYFPHLQKGPVG